MGLAIDGNVVHGLAVSGQPFFPITRNNDGSIDFEGQNYSEGGNSLNVYAPGSIILIQGDFRIDFSTLESNLKSKGKSLNGKTFYLIVICDVSSSGGNAEGVFSAWGPLTWGKNEKVQEIGYAGSGSGSSISVHDFADGMFYIGHPQDIDSEDNTLVYMLYSN